MTSLLFDLTASQPNGSGKRHGGGKYCEMLFLALCARKKQFKAFYDSEKYINPSILNSAIRNEIELYDIRKQNLNDIVLAQGITHLYSALPEQLIPWPNCVILGTIHGLRSYEMPADLFSEWQFDSELIGLGAIIRTISHFNEKKQIQQHYQKLLHEPNFYFVTVSEHSKKVIQSFAPQKDIPVFYPPSTTYIDISIKSKQSYFLLVSANRIEKNCIRAIIALDKLYKANKIPQNITVKVTGLTEPSFRYSLKHPEQFDFLGYVEETELANLYANSYCLIYPSLNEGFGYPPLEAMRYGTPVIASTASSIPEVCGDAVLYINPKSIHDIKKQILKIIDIQVKNTFSQKSLNQFNIVSQRQHKDTQNLIDWIFTQKKTTR